MSSLLNPVASFSSIMITIVYEENQLSHPVFQRSLFFETPAEYPTILCMFSQQSSSSSCPSSLSLSSSSLSLLLIDRPDR